MKLNELKRCSWQDLLEYCLKQKQEINELRKAVKREGMKWRDYYRSNQYRKGDKNG